MRQLPYYEKDGVRYDRVTAVLDYFAPPELVRWQIKVGAKEAKRIGTVAKNIGTSVDEWIKADINGLRPRLPKSLEARNCIEGWKRFKKE